jgi:hypothetical protein
MISNAGIHSSFRFRIGIYAHLCKDSVLVYMRSAFESVRDSCLITSASTRDCQTDQKLIVGSSSVFSASRTCSTLSSGDGDGKSLHVPCSSSMSCIHLGWSVHHSSGGVQSSTLGSHGLSEVMCMYGRVMKYSSV